MHCWWANQDRDYAEETAGGYLWCRQRRSNGSRNPFYENVRLAHRGDVIFAYAGGAIRAVGVVISPPRESTRPGAVPPGPDGAGDAAVPGWLLDMAWMELKRPLVPSSVMDILAPLLPAMHSPLTPDGRGIQGGRLLELPTSLSIALLQLAGGARPDQLINPVWRPRQLDLPFAPAAAPDAGAEAATASEPAAEPAAVPAAEPGGEPAAEPAARQNQDAAAKAPDEPDAAAEPGEREARDPSAPLAGESPESKMIAVDVTKPFPFAEYFDPSKRLEIDVGCGKGRFLLAHAAANPDTQFLGIERQLPRVRRIDRKAIRAGLDNVHLLRLEAAYALEFLLPEDSVDRFYVLFPDPWPKRRHHRRRLFQPEFLDVLWKRLKSGGEIQVATDDADYFHEIEKIFSADPRFIPAEPFERPPEEQTDFELIFRGKGLAVNAAAWRIEKPSAQPA